MSEKSQNVVEVKNLGKYFPIKAGLFGRVVGHVHAVEDVSFNIKRGTTMGLVGESGCGKTTIGKTILNLTEKTSGSVVFNGETEVDKLSSKERRAFRPKIQLIFQDPYSSLSRACRFPKLSARLSASTRSCRTASLTRTSPAS